MKLWVSFADPINRGYPPGFAGGYLTSLDSLSDPARRALEEVLLLMYDILLEG